MSTGSPKGSSNKKLFIILGIVGGVVLLGCLGCVGLGGFIYYQVQNKDQYFSNELGAEAAGTSFLAYLDQGNVESAYQIRTTTGFRTRQGLEQFRAFVNQHPGLRNHSSRTIDTTRHDGNRLTLSATVRTSGTGQTIIGTLEMIQEGGQWKVDRFTIP